MVGKERSHSARHEVWNGRPQLPLSQTRSGTLPLSLAPSFPVYTVLVNVFQTTDETSYGTEATVSAFEIP